MLTSFQLVSLDFWENVYNNVSPAIYSYSAESDLSSNTIVNIISY